jgi:hypothetical protein
MTLLYEDAPADKFGIECLKNSLTKFDTFVAFEQLPWSVLDQPKPPVHIQILYLIVVVVIVTVIQCVLCVANLF